MPVLMQNDLPDELLLRCTDMSLRTCVMLASTNSQVRARLMREAKARGLRLACNSPFDAMDIERSMNNDFHIGALHLTSDAWPFPVPRVIVDLEECCPNLKIVILQPHLKPRIDAI